MIHVLCKLDALPAQGFEDVERFMRTRFEVDTREYLRSWRVYENLHVVRGKDSHTHLCASDYVQARDESYVIGVVWMSNADVRQATQDNWPEVITGTQVESARKAILASIQRLDRAFQASIA